MKQKRKFTPEEARQYNEEIEALSRYLSQRRKAKRRKKNLEKRLMEIREEMKHPISAVGYSPINAPTNEISEGSASFTFRTADCELKIYEQADRAAKDLLKIMDIMDYLEDGDEREAMELYYIDGLTWERVAERMDVSRSQAFKFRRAGLERLLTYKRVRKIVEKFKAEEADRQETQKKI